MRNQRGFAPIVIIVIIVLVGAGVYAVVNRAVLKSYLEREDKPTADQRTVPDDTSSGDKPTASQFKDVIDSSVNLVDDAARQATPVNVAPENKKSFAQAEAEKGIVFRWTALVPKPKEPVTYRMKVWQLMQGQSGSQAMKTNKPIVTRDVMDITETTASNIYTGPCKPPYLCDFVWSVDAIGSGGTLSGSSEPFTFSVVEENTPTGSSTDSSAR